MPSCPRLVRAGAIGIRRPVIEQAPTLLAVRAGDVQRCERQRRELATLPVGADVIDRRGEVRLERDRDGGGRHVGHAEHARARARSRRRG